MSKDYAAELLSLGREYATGGSVQVHLKTNLGPAIPIYTGTSSEPSILDTLGLRAGLIVTDRNGKPVTTYGDPAPTDPLLFGLLVLSGLSLAGLLLRGVWK